MLSEIAIHDIKGFEAIVNSAKKALESNQKPAAKEVVISNVENNKEKTADFTIVSETKKTTTTKKVEAKAETKEEVKEEVKETKDLSSMTLAELKAEAKAQGKKGYSTLKKDELIELLK
ncbi:MAG: Rho termination factor N-terminal domain-containing protein [Bacilli bacterium]|nr:Rho termination factor N-terminal domain-containing protein [Bacilli bacterium]